MSLETDIRPISYLKPKAVLQDPVSYQNMRNAIGLLKLIAQGEESVRSGRVKSQKDVFADLEKRLTDR